MPKYTEWCTYCDAETEYDKGWREVRCSDCGRMLMPCDWCIVTNARQSDTCGPSSGDCILCDNPKFNKERRKPRKEKGSTIPMTWDNFEELLWKRNSEWGDAPAYVVDYYLEKLRNNGGCNNPENNDPKTIMDNIAVNGSYGPFDNWQRPDEADDDFIERMLETFEGAVILKDERVIILPSPTMEEIIYG